MNHNLNNQAVGVGFIRAHHKLDDKMYWESWPTWGVVTNLQHISACLNFNFCPMYGIVYMAFLDTYPVHQELIQKKNLNKYHKTRVVLGSDCTTPITMLLQSTKECSKPACAGVLLTELDSDSGDCTVAQGSCQATRDGFCEVMNLSRNGTNDK